MPPLNYEIRLHGTSEDGDPDKVKAAFGRVVRELRSALATKGDALPITVAGSLGGRVEAYRDADDQLVPVEPLGINAADVEDEAPKGGKSK